MAARAEPDTQPEDYQALLDSNHEELEWLAKMIENMLFLAKEDACQALNEQRIDLALLETGMNP